MKLKCISLESKRDMLFREHDIMTEKMLETPEGGAEREKLLMQARIIARKYRRVLMLIKMKNEIENEKIA